MKKFFLSLFVLIVLMCAIGYVASPISPVAWEPAVDPGLTGEFSPNKRLANVERMLDGVGVGPEAVACGGDGAMYTGLLDGRILSFNAAGEYSELANTGGRPLGMKVAQNGKLIVADAQRGLLSVSMQGDVEVLTNSVNGIPMLFVDDLDIAEDGVIWFSDASARYDFHSVMLDFMEGQRTGRLLSYHPDTGETKVQLDGLFFANGVALGPRDEYVLVNETGTGQIQRLWLKGERAGQRGLFHAGLPGAPDNITFNGSDRFWVSMPSLRGGVDALAGKPLLRRYLSLLPTEILAANAANYSFVVALDSNGKVALNLQDSDRGYLDITSAVECQGDLYLGSLTMPALARFSLSQE